MQQIPKRAMAATDMSARCDRAIDRGLQLADEWGTELAIAHILSKRDAAEDPALVEAKIQATLPDPAVPVQIFLAEGSVPEKLQDLVTSATADLLLTGVARHNELGDYISGTAVDHIVRNSDVPVLVVKRRPRGPYRSIVVAIDLSECSKKAVLAAIRLFPNVQLELVHAYHVPFEAWLDSPDMRSQVTNDIEAKLTDFLSHPDLAQSRDRLNARISYGESQRVIAEAVREAGADLLVMGTHDRSGLVHATIGSMAESILSWADVDTLMVREVG